MGKIKVKVEWLPKARQWHLMKLDTAETHIQEVPPRIYNCGIFQELFDGADKTKARICTIQTGDWEDC